MTPEIAGDLDVAYADAKLDLAVERLRTFATR
jgi:hypothetical protein